MKSLKFYWIILSTIILTSCASVKATRLRNDVLLNYQDSVKVVIEKIENGAQNAVPPFEVWNTDRNEFIAMIKDYKDRNEIIRRKSQKAGNFFTISGTALGVSGGIYGLFSDSEPKGAAVTSLVTGALTGLVGSMHLEKKAERANTCSDFLDGIMLDFAARWGCSKIP